MLELLTDVPIEDDEKAEESNQNEGKATFSSQLLEKVRELKNSSLVNEQQYPMSPVIFSKKSGYGIKSDAGQSDEGMELPTVLSDNGQPNNISQDMMSRNMRSAATWNKNGNAVRMSRAQTNAQHRRTHLS